MISVNDMGAVRLMMRARLLRLSQLAAIGTRDHCVGGHCTASETGALDRGGCIRGIRSRHGGKRRAPGGATGG